MNRTCLTWAAAAMVVFCSAGVGFAENLVPDPTGDYADASGTVRTKYSKTVWYFPNWPTPQISYTATTRLSVKKLDPRETYRLVCYANVGWHYWGIPFQPANDGSYSGIASEVMSNPKFRINLYEVWRCEFDDSTGEWVPVTPVLSSDPDLSGLW